MGTLNGSVLMYNSQGEDVKKLQNALNQNGFSIKVDGIFGNETKNALMKYQMDNGLAIDGIAGAATWSSLNKAVKNLNAKNAAPTYQAYEAPEFKMSDATSTADLNKNIAESKVKNYKYGKQGELDTLLDTIQNRKFTYDVNSDALYQQYADQYIRQGKMAMQDTMGQAAAMTGGYGNSYAATAGNQAYQAYLGKINEVVPELYQMALDKYNSEGNDLYNQYGLLTDDKNAEYNRIVADRDYATNNYNTLYDNDWDKYVTDVGIGQTEHQNVYNSEYQAWLAEQSQANWEKEYALNERQVALQEQQYEDSKSTTSNSSSTAVQGQFDKVDNKNNNNNNTTKYDYNYVLAQVKDDVKNGEDISSISNYLRLAWKSGYITDKEYESLKNTYVPRSSTGTGAGGHYAY